MRYIITEEQNNILHVLRRTAQDHDLIEEIVSEGMEMWLCNYDNFNNFYNHLCYNSSITYLLNYFDDTSQEGFSKMKEYITDYIKENFSEMIIMYWKDNKEDC